MASLVPAAPGTIMEHEEFEYSGRKKVLAVVAWESTGSGVMAPYVAYGEQAVAWSHFQELVSEKDKEVSIRQATVIVPHI